MPVLAFVNPKGGAGKTTAAMVLACELAKQAKVVVLDGDPNRPIGSWAAGGHVPANMEIISDVNEENIIDMIELASEKAPFVIVDLEGTASKIVVMAVSQADFVIIPMQGSHLDSKEAGKALKVIRQQEQMVQKRMADYRLPFSILLTRTNPAFRTKTVKAIENEMYQGNIPVFQTELNDREPFRSIFAFQRPLDELEVTTPSDKHSLKNAVRNAGEYAKEVVETLRKVMASNE